MILADYAQVADGKLTIVGGGWSVTGPRPTPFAIALLFEVPWDQANVKHRFRLDLVDADGHMVFMPTAEESEDPVALEGEFETGRPPGLKPGTTLVGADRVQPARPADPARRPLRVAVDGERRERRELAPAVLDARRVRAQSGVSAARSTSDRSSVDSLLDESPFARAYPRQRRCSPRTRV